MDCWHATDAVVFCAVAGAVFIVQILAMGYFAGDQRGLNLPLGAVSMNAYSYKGLVSNELRAGRTWGCPQEGFATLQNNAQV